MTAELGVWTETKVADHLCDVYEPPAPCEPGYTVIYLHGVHEQRLAEHDAFNRQFARRGLRVIAPYTGQSWWTDRVCREFDPELSAEDHVFKNVVPEIATRWGAKPPRIALLGTSMGGQGALRLSYKRPDIFPVVAAIAPAIDFHKRWEEGDPVLTELYHSAERARQDTATLYIHPLNWPRQQFFCCDPTDERWWEGADRLRMKLYSLGVPHECDLETSAGGHGFEYYNAMAQRAVDFIFDSLEKERRRLV